MLTSSSPVVTGMTVRTVENRLAMTRSQGSGTVRRTVRRVVVSLETDAGVVGWGEAAPWTVFSGSVESAAAALHIHFRPLVIGRPAHAVRSILDDCRRALACSAEAQAALEMALFDILGKSLGVPVHRLLGGAVRTSIPLSFSLADPDLEADLRRVRDLTGEGIGIFKVKTGFLSHAEDMRRLEKIRATAPAKANIRIDYNQALSPIEAARCCRDMEQFSLGFIEQPVAAQHWDCMAELARNLATPLLADESVFTPEQALAAAGRRIADAFSVKLMKAGGLLPAQSIAAIAEAGGIACYAGTLWEGAIGLAAGAHFVAATPAVTLGCEFYMPRYVFDPTQCEATLDVADGRVQVPTGPGLGIDVDEDVLDSITTERLT